MKELGRVLERLVSLIAVAPSNSPDFRFSKLDIKDGFWRVKVTEQDSWNFCYVLPPKTTNGKVSLDDIQIVVPDSLQMGWTESPPFFYFTTETARDIAEELINNEKLVPVHPLESLCVPSHKWKDEHIGKNCDNLINQLEVYVDDFIMMSQCVTKQEL